MDGAEGQGSVSTKQAVLQCRYCGKPTVHLVEKPNHILHLLLSVLTAGLWLIVWLIIALHLRDKDEICTVCGSQPPEAAHQRALQASQPTRPRASAVSFGRSLGRFVGRLRRPPS